MTTAPDPQADKTSRRRTIRARRRAARATRDRTADGLAISAAVDGLALSAAVEGLAWQPHELPTWVAAYESLPTEPPTEALIERLQARGIRVLVPVLLPDLDLDWRELVAGDPPDALSSPLGPNAITLAEVILTPALAVDRRGVRLGQGGGSYDRALARRRAGSLVLAIVYDDELVDEPLPHQDHDQRVDAVITPRSGLVQLFIP